MNELDFEATLALLGRRDTQPVRIRLDADPPCGLTAEFGAASQGRIRAVIAGVPAGTLVRAVVLVAFHGEELGCVTVGRNVGHGGEIGVELRWQDMRWTAL